MTEAGRLDDEYAAARERCAVTALPGRALLEVTGPLRVKFLHGVLSNDVQGVPAGSGRRAALMDVKGRQLAWMRVLVDEGAVVLETATETCALLEQQLVHYRVAAPVRFARREVAVLALLGPGAPDVLRAAGAGELPEAAESHRPATLGGVPARVVRAGDLPACGFAVHVEPAAAGTVLAALTSAGARLVGRLTLDALRVEEGRAWHGVDVADDNLLHETGLVGEYHSPSKGCYVGQEVVARLEGRGAHVNRQLRGLRLARPAAAGDALTADGREVGRVTTAAVSPREGPIAMAYVHRSHAEPGTTVTVGGTPARVVALPFSPRPS